MLFPLPDGPKSDVTNPFVLKDMKRFTVEHDKQYQIIKKCEDIGIKVKTMFIIGNPEILFYFSNYNFFRNDYNTLVFQL